jgi:chromosome segregation protein
VLDNSAGTIEDRGAEISITRRVFKSGEGEYQIDGQKGRLKDIKEMLFDTGLGSRGYSVLEQGRIDAVLSANPIDRRRIFEEAAGISRYRQRKHETELRLARVQQDLARLEDVTGELRSRVRSLKIQAGKAERFVTARKEWETLKTRLVKHQLFTLGGELEGIATTIGELEGQLERMRAERGVSELEIERLEGERSEVSRKVEEFGREASSLEGDARALAERRDQLLSRVKGWELSARDEDQRADEMDSQIAERARELTVLEEQKTALDLEIEAVRESAENRGRERRALVRSYNEFRTEVEAQNERLLHQLHEKTAAQNTLGHLEEARGPAEVRFVRVADRLEEAREQLSVVRDEEEQSSLEVSGAEDRLETAEVAAREAREWRDSLDEELERLESARTSLEVEIARRASHIESLLDRDRELEDLGAGARAALDAVAEGAGPCPTSHLVGLLADHLTIGTEYARALDTVLAERSQALVVASEEDAHLLAGWLEEQSEGQAALCVLGGLGVEELVAPPELPSELSDQVIGALLDEIECELVFEPIARTLCGGVLLVRDLLSAMKIVHFAPSLSCVTPEGELVDAAGLVAGERTFAQGAVGRRARSAELQVEVEELEQRAARLDVELRGARSRREELALSLSVATDELGARRDQLAVAQGHQRTAEARERDLAASLDLLESESSGVIAERQQLERDLVDARFKAEEVQVSFERENEALQQLENRRRELEEERDESARAEGRSRIELTRVEEQIGGLDHRLADLRRVREENLTEVERARRLSRDAAESARIGTEESAELARRSAELASSREEVEGRLGEARRRGQETDQRLDALRSDRDAVTRLLEERSSGLSKIQLEEQRVDLARQDIERRTVEELGLEVETLLEGFEIEEELRELSAVTALEEKVDELHRRLERLGPVNVEALGELEEVGGRLEFMETQIDDLVRARRGLADTLKKIEEESERLFVETFEEVRVNFQRVFRQLFGGGKADVQLAEGEPVLEAGVEITARPPGREMLPIGLLSGGQRTMTALALLFAVFEARPSPFCVLDEVDAALDEANIQRFLALLAQFRTSTQFVIVTHNKGTMEACESLYGVTMQTKGVSRQVSVSLEEVDEIVPEVAKPVDKESGEPIVEIVPASGGEEAREVPSGEACSTVEKKA